MIFWIEINSQTESNKVTTKTYAKEIQGYGCLVKTEVWVQSNFLPLVNLVFIPGATIHINEETKEAFLI